MMIIFLRLHLEDKRLLRKLHFLTFLITCILAFTVISVAESEVRFHIYNPTTVTTNVDATYIQGDISRAKGQIIKVNGPEGLVAEKTLPDTGKKYSFRIKVPKESIKTDKINSYSVTATTAEGKQIRTTYVVVKYKPRKDQSIDVKKKEFEVECPGEPVAIDASSSAGLDLDYQSSNEDIVKVDDEGNIEAVGEGTAEISVIQSNDNEYEDASETIKVSVKEVPHFTVRFHLGKNAELSEEEGGKEETEEDAYIEAVLDVEENAEEPEEEGSDEDLIVEQKIAVNQKTKLLAANDSKGDYEFIGWAESETGQPQYDNSETVIDIADEDQTIDLYAVWHGERAQKAVDWAIELAADDRFGYGRGSSECCICHNLVKKYTCMPFIAASYAHGIGDLSLLSKGRSGWHYIHLSDRNFTDGKLNGVWEKIGLCRDLTIDDLEPGDVIIKYSADDGHGHAWMYAGEDKIVEAVPAKNYADQIAVKNGAAAKLRRYGSSEGTPSKNYVMRYRF